jgi:hypothetical protein
MNYRTDCICLAARYLSRKDWNLSYFTAGSRWHAWHFGLGGQGDRIRCTELLMLCLSLLECGQGKCDFYGTVHLTGMKFCLWKFADIYVSLDTHSFESSIDFTAFPIYAVHLTSFSLCLIPTMIYELCKCNWLSACLVDNIFCHGMFPCCRWQWPRSLRHAPFSPSRTLGSWVRIQLEAWMSMCFDFVLCCSVCR